MAMTVTARLPGLDERSDVGVCFRHACVPAGRKCEIEHRARAVPIGRPFRSRVLFRAGFNRG